MMTDFAISNDTMVVTSTYVTINGLPILEVSHEDDEGGSLWQFHCGNGDYSIERMQLVRLDTILKFDSNLTSIADLKKGFTARRKSIADTWSIDRC